MQGRPSWRGVLGSLTGILAACTCVGVCPPVEAAPARELTKLAASDAAPNDQFGGSAAVSGDTLVVGAYLEDEVGPDRGAAYVYERNQGGPDQWGEVTKLVASDAAQGDQFGVAVAIDGDTIVVGARYDDDSGSNSGSAYVYERNQGGADSWGEVAKLTASDSASGDWFGNAVAVSGDMIVVAASYAGPSDSGSAYVYERNRGGADNWGEVRKLTSSDSAQVDYFGISVGISGDTVVVGAVFAASGSVRTGAAYLFERNAGGADNWGEIRKLVASDGAVSDRFGWSVGVSVDTVVVGAYFDDDAGSRSGSAYVYERNQGGADNWGEVGKLTASDAAADDEFGYAVGISGDTVVVGARYDDDADPDCGAAYIFERNAGGTDNWGEVQKLTASDAATGDQLGYRLAISDDTMVVGAPHNDETGLDSGAAYIFVASDCNWAKAAKPIAPDGAAADWFGHSVAISGDTMVVGACNDDDLGVDSGSAYIFSRNQGGADTWDLVRKLTASDGAEQDLFAYGPVAISGDTVVIGAHGNDDAGSAYVFERNQGGADNWGEVKKLTASDAVPGQTFGYAVGVSGDTALVGTYSGVAYVFERNQGGADNWGEVRKLIPSDPGQHHRSVAINGDTVVLGAWLHDGVGPASGSAYVFERNRGGPDNWGEVRKLTASDAAADDHFGSSVAVSGDTVVVGAYRDDDAGTNSGSAYVYERNRGGADNWGEVRKLIAADAAAYDHAGWSVFIDGDKVVVGADGDDDMGSLSGSAHVFERNRGGADDWGEAQKLIATDGEPNDHFGWSVSISGGTVVIGAYYDAIAESNNGSSYVFSALSSLPAEVRGLTVQGTNLTSVSWIDQGAPWYDVAGGLISELVADGGTGSAECLDDDVPTASSVDSRSNPAPGAGYYYIVRAQLDCDGTYGWASPGAERVPANACP